MKYKTGGPAFHCKWCENLAHIKQGRIYLCAVHYRFSSMRTRAKRDGKDVPDYAYLESLVPNPFLCPVCKVSMNWLSKEGHSTVITLQHDRDGTMRLICFKCNMRHSNFPEDTYYELPENHWRCSACGCVKPLEEFPTDRSRPLGKKSYCKLCSNIRMRNWVAKRRDHVNQKQREGRRKRGEVSS